MMGFHRQCQNSR